MTGTPGNIDFGKVRTEGLYGAVQQCGAIEHKSQEAEVSDPSPAEMSTTSFPESRLGLRVLGSGADGYCGLEAGRPGRLPLRSV